MPELVLILPDFQAPTAQGASEAGLPRLGALELLLARAPSTMLSEGWRAWLAREVGGPQLAAIAPAGVAASAWIPVPTGLLYWMATPVHYFAGLDSLHLHPAGLLPLPPEAQHTLCEDFARVFHDSGFRLHATLHRDLLLSGPVIPVAKTHDPARWLGSDPSPALPSGEGAATLRRLGAEIEMWLHEHAVNRERIRQGYLPVSALWLWGGAALPPERGAGLLRGGARSARVYAGDTYCEGLARLCGAGIGPLPPRWTLDLVAGALGPPAPAAAQLIVAVIPAAPAGPLAGLAQTEQDWIRPALSDLGRGRLAALSLIVGTRRYRASRLQMRRFWRTPRPWWHTLGSASEGAGERA